MTADLLAVHGTDSAGQARGTAGDRSGALVAASLAALAATAMLSASFAALASAAVLSAAFSAAAFIPFSATFSARAAMFAQAEFYVNAEARE